MKEPSDEVVDHTITEALNIAKLFVIKHCNDEMAVRTLQVIDAARVAAYEQGIMGAALLGEPSSEPTAAVAAPATNMPTCDDICEALSELRYHTDCDNKYCDAFWTGISDSIGAIRNLFAEKGK